MVIGMITSADDADGSWEATSRGSAPTSNCLDERMVIFEVRVKWS